MFTIVVAIGKNNELGIGNNLLEYFPEDLKFFYQITKNNYVILGRKTYESIPKKNRPLKNRFNIILTSNQNFIKDSKEKNIDIYNLEDFLSYYKSLPNDKKYFVIGGQSIYEEFLNRNLIDKMIITHINKNYSNATHFFPEINLQDWQITNSHFLDENKILKVKYYTNINHL